MIAVHTSLVFERECDCDLIDNSFLIVVSLPLSHFLSPASFACWVSQVLRLGRAKAELA